MASLSFHRSMRGNCFTWPVLDLLTYLWPLCIHCCTFTPVFCGRACLSTTDHCPFQDSPFLSKLLFHLHILYLYQSCHSSVWPYIFGLCEVSPSPFPAVHQLWSVTGLCEVIMTKTSTSLWKSGNCYVHKDFILQNCLFLKDFHAKFCFSLILSCFKVTLSLRNLKLTRSLQSLASVRHQSLLVRGLAVLLNSSVAEGIWEHHGNDISHSLHHKGSQFVFHLWATVHKWLSWKVFVGLGVLCHIWPPTGQSFHRKVSTKNVFKCSKIHL